MAKKYDGITAIVDTREQTPLDLERWGLKVVRRKLDHGDYSLAFPNLERLVALERKTLPDFIACCTHERARFERELLALRGYTWKGIYCEFHWEQVLAQQYRSKVHPNAVIGSMCCWSSMGIPFVTLSTHEQLSYVVAQSLLQIAKQQIDLSMSSTKLML